MQSVLIVVAPAQSSDLTILATVKSELGITTGAEDQNIELWIDQASAACAAYCNRVFGQETVTETFRNRFANRTRYNRGVENLLLERNPVSSITSVVEDTVTLVQDVDFQLDPATGKIWRLTSDAIVNWDFDKLTVTYIGGYALLGSLPANVERACISMVKLLRSAATRDPTVKEENIPGVLQTSYWVGAVGDNGALPPDVTALLDPYRNVSV